MFALAAALSDRAPSLAILANGGAIARAEALANVRQGREIIVIAGSGRLADVIAAAVVGKTEPPDEDIATIVQSGRVTLFDIADESEALAALIRRELLQESCPCRGQRHGRCLSWPTGQGKLPANTSSLRFAQGKG